MITKKNLSKDNITQHYYIIVGITIVLGNPFKMKNEKDRNLVCDHYHEWFYKNTHGPRFFAMLQELEELYKKYSKLNLFCWCAPKRCHAETIKEYVETQLKDE
jgi:hypothetical protein